MTASYVRSADADGGASSLSTLGANFAANGAGNLITVWIGFVDAAGTVSVTSVTDGAGNTYYVGHLKNRNATQQYSEYMYYAWGVASSAGTNTVTVNLSAATTFIRIHAMEHTSTNGAWTFDPLDQVGQGTGNSTALATSTMTPRADNEIFMVMGGHGAATALTAGTGYTLRSTAGMSTGAADLVQTTATANTGKLTSDASGQWGCIGATFFDAGTNLIDTHRVADRGSAQNLTSQTSTAVDLPAGGSIAVGNYLVARLALDNSGTNGAAVTLTVTDPRSNTWTVESPANIDPGAANAGSTCYIAYVRVVNAYSNGDDITFDYSSVSVPAKAIVVEEWRGIHITPLAVASTTATGTSTTPSIARTPAAANQTVYAALASEGPGTDTYTPDTDTTEGTWRTLTSLATTSGTAASNQFVRGGYKTTSGTSAQTFNPTITSRDWAAVALVFARAQVAGTVDPGLPALTMEFAGAVSEEVTGALAVTLPALTADLAGDASVTAAATVLLPALVADVSADVLVDGGFAHALPALTASASATVAVTAVVDVTLPALTADLAGNLAVAATLDVALPAAAVVFAADVSLDGDLVAGLPAAAVATTGSVAAEAVLGVTLPAAVVDLAGTVSSGTTGIIDLTLPALAFGAAGSAVATADLGLLLPAMVAAFTGRISGALIQRPDTGTIARPSTGTITRPSTGTITRPSTGLIIKPDEGQILRP